MWESGLFYGSFCAKICSLSIELCEKKHCVDAQCFFHVCREDNVLDVVLSRCILNLILQNWIVIIWKKRFKSIHLFIFLFHLDGFSNNFIPQRKETNFSCPTKIYVKKIFCVFRLYSLPWWISSFLTTKTLFSPNKFAILISLRTFFSIVAFIRFIMM